MPPNLPTLVTHIPCLDVTFYGNFHNSRKNYSSSGVHYSFTFSEIRNRDLTHTDYICEIRTALNCERGLTSANRATVFDALDRLHERLREAEESRDVVVGQVKELKQQCQVRVKHRFATFSTPTQGLIYRSGGKFQHLCNCEVDLEHKVLAL